MAFRNSYTGLGGRSSQPLMSSSMSPLSPSVTTRNGHPSYRQTHASSNISKTYRQASTLFLTRRLPEALTTLLPLITPPHADDDDGTSSHVSFGNGNGASAVPLEPVPVAGASRTTRIKVWSLYLTILNAILELGPEEGKDAFGTQDWRALCAKVRDGDVWEEVVRNGYSGVEGDVDADVVINLATLLLAHAPSQALNQTRLESYLSYSQMPNLDLSHHHFSASQTRRPLSRARSPSKGASGTDTPRDLNARVKILELYTLHVLLRNDQWDYAREFISASPILDEERREAFLLALQSLHDDQHEAEHREQEERQRQEEQRQRDLENDRRIRAENEDRERRRIEEERARRSSIAASARSDASDPRGIHHRAPSSTAGSSSAKGTSNGRPRPSRTARTTPSASAAKTAKGKAKAVAAPPSLGARTATVFANVRALIEQMAASLQASPVAMVRTLLFIVALLVMLGRRNVRQRISRILGSSWAKVKATAGMGVKVSYI